VDNITPSGSYLTVEPQFLDYADSQTGAACTPGSSTTCVPADLHPGLGSPLIKAGDPTQQDWTALGPTSALMAAMVGISGMWMVMEHPTTSGPVSAPMLPPGLTRKTMTWMIWTQRYSRGES